MVSCRSDILGLFSSLLKGLYASFVLRHFDFKDGVYRRLGIHGVLGVLLMSENCKCGADKESVSSNTGCKGHGRPSGR